MKRISALASIMLCICIGCASQRMPPKVQRYREDGLPLWVGATFSDPQAYWGCFISERGFYASGEGKSKDVRIATKIAVLDAKVRLANYAVGQKNATLFGVRQVDSFVAEDGTVYVLMFISTRNAKKAQRASSVPPPL